MQIIDQVKEMEDQIMGYLKTQKIIQEKIRIEMKSKYEDLIKKKSNERNKIEEELNLIMNKIKEKTEELSKMDVMIKDVSKDNDCILKVSLKEYNYIDNRKILN